MKAQPALVFQFYLARELGMSVAILKQSMTSLEIGQWHAYFRHQAREDDAARKRAELDARVKSRAARPRNQRRR